LTVRGFPRKRERSPAAPRVGLFGLLGSGNIGNDASMESVLRYLRADHPGAVVDAMCKGPATVAERYGIEAIALGWYQQHWYERREKRASGATTALKALGKGVDVFRTARWVRRHDVVIVPGMGVLEATLPVAPLEMPYAMFLVSASGRLFGTKVALISVGASVINQRLTRWLIDSAARLAFYRSYRDVGSRDAMRQRGLDVTRDRVYADLAFGIPVPSCERGDPQTVGVGVMNYHGSNDDRGQATEIYVSYVETMKLFVRWLVDSGRRVRLLVGDTNNADQNVVPQILADLRMHRPDLDPAWVVAEPISSFAELMQAMAPAGVVVATRFHNMICALMLSKPTISLGYAPKFTTLMSDMGLAGFCQSTKTLALERLIEQFEELDKRQAELRQAVMAGKMAKARLVDDQFAELSDVLFRSDEQAPDAAENRPASRGVR
jgi:polysaccharide pyruvyl transferase WcaK-like protein